MLNLATFYRQEKNYDEATRFLKKVIELKDDESSEAAQEELNSIKEARKQQ